VVRCLIEWTSKAMETEVWSIRKVAVQLIGVIGFNVDLSFDYVCSLSNQLQDDDNNNNRNNKNKEDELLLLDSIFAVLTIGFNDQKYVKIRIEVLITLKKLILGINKMKIEKNFSETVRNLIKSACNDAQPSVLENVSKVQECWLALTSSTD
jgi:hypothetical protein